MKKRFALCLLLCLVLLSASVLADGYAYGDHFSRRYGTYISLKNGGLESDGYESADGYGVLTTYGEHVIEIVTKSASVWKEPKTGSKRLGTVSNGDTLPCRTDGYNQPESSGGFYKVEYKGSTGWVNCDYAVLDPLRITLQDSNVKAYAAPYASAKCVGSLAKCHTYTVIGFFDDYYVVNLRGGSAFVRMDVRCYDNTFSAQYPYEWQMAVTTRHATLRTGPGEDYPEVAELKTGKELSVLDEIDGWLVLEYSDKNTDGTVLVFVSMEEAELEGNG